MSNNNARRIFLQQIGATGLLAASAPFTSLSLSAKAEERILQYDRKIAANDKIRIGVIGYGVQGHFDLRTALKVQGVELAGICDLYQGRLVNAKEQYGEALYCTNNYKDLLDRPDIDAVLICTTDVWHARITLDALAKGKHVYCEKPMVYKISEGYPVVAAAQKSGKVLQVGSQRVSSIVYQKAKELLAAGEIGQLNMVNAVYDRQSSIGAWQYTIPSDADPITTNWDTFIEATEKMAYDSKKFFWWRAFKEVGTGGQEVIRLVGSEGVMDVNGNNVTIKHSIMPDAPGFGGYDSLFTFSKSMQESLQKEYSAKWTAEQKRKKVKEDIVYKAPPGYDDHLDHFTNFFDAIRTGKPVIEDASFGFRAAAPALACNESYFSKKIVQWDPENMKVKK